ncbi:MAG TPA: endonuclease MutS2, partial [Acholeplasmataceae bacterium]|nr:endonuclease MutS2 [Acholeplasmataceae bacterium]
MEKYYKILELDKIIQKIQELCQLEETKTNLKNLKLLNDLDKINDTLAEVDEATILIQRMQRFPLYFKSDLRKTLNLINKGYVINLDELLVIAKFLDTIKANQVYLDTIENLKIETKYFKKNVDKLFYPKELNLRIKDIITPYGEINDHATVELAKIRKAIRDTEKNIQVKLQDAISKNSNKLTDTIISIRNDRYVIPVKHEFKNVVKGIIHDQSASGETVFIEPLVVNELNNKLNDLKESEKKEIYSIFLEVSNKVKSFYHELRSNLNVIVHLDLVFAKAEYALSINAKKPKLNNKGILELYQCRHPLLNVDEVVPNNVIIGKDYQGIIITGPNTGGKTVLLKTVGLLSIMVKAGLLV